MNTPPPPGYYNAPPPPRQNSSGGCWKAAGITCSILLLLTILGGYLAYLSIKKAIKNPNGAVAIAVKTVTTVAEGVVLQQDIEKYKAENGSYPKNLAALVPKYAKPSELHADLDPTTDPTHVSWKYIRPTASTPGTSPMLELPLTIDGEKRTVIINVDGSTNNGKSGGFDSSSSSSPFGGGNQ